MAIATTSSSSSGDPPPKLLRWGFLGCGKISNDFIHSVNKDPRHRAVACAAQQMQRAQAFAKAHGIDQAYDSYEQLCQDPQVDIVYVGTLHTTHFEHASLALNHTKHVLVEKPMCMNSQQVHQLISLARQRKCFLMEGMWTRFFPAVRFVRELLAQKRIGAIHHVNGDFGFATEESCERFWLRKLGGGGLLSYGIYPLAFVTMVFGFGKAPQKIHASGSISSDQGVDLFGNISLVYPDNCFGTAQYSCLGDFHEQVVITGSNGKIMVESPAHVASRVTLYEKQCDGSMKPTHFEFPMPETNVTMNFGGSEGFCYEVEAVGQLILDQNALESEEYPLDESLRLAQIMDAVRQQMGVVYEADSFAS